MSGFFWLLVNGALLVTALGVTTWVRNYEPPAPWSDTVSEERDTRSRGRSQGRAAEADAAVDDARLAAQDLDDLWANTLFRPERTEDVAAAVEQAGQENAAEAIQMELIGVGKIGDKPVAIILDKTPPRQAVRRLTRSNRFPGTAVQEEESTPARTQHIYREGSEVGSTGYTVTTIGFREVLLTRGDEELTLTLEAGDDQSQVRRERAAASDRARQTQAAAAPPAAPPRETAGRSVTPPVAPGDAPPPPPPPPVTAAPVPVPDGKAPVVRTPTETNAENGNPAAMSREERLRRAKLLRERILQRRQEQTN